MMTSCPCSSRRTTVLAPMNPAPPVTNHRIGPSASVLAQPQDGQERILRDLARPDALPTLLPLLLPFEQLLRARDVAAVALGQNVFAHRPDIGAGDHPAAGHSLDRYSKQLARDELLELRDQRLPL